MERGLSSFGLKIRISGQRGESKLGEMRSEDSNCGATDSYKVTTLGEIHWSTRLSRPRRRDKTSLGLEIQRDEALIVLAYAQQTKPRIHRANYRGGARPFPRSGTKSPPKRSCFLDLTHSRLRYSRTRRRVRGGRTDNRHQPARCDHQSGKGAVRRRDRQSPTP